MMLAVCLLAAAVGRADVMMTPPAGGVRLHGALAEKVERFLDRRVYDARGFGLVFDEALQAFVQRDDDEDRLFGFWRGEFWGKSMLSAARLALYRQDDALKGRIAEQCRRLFATADGDGYVGSYRDRLHVCVTPEMLKVSKWSTNWNLWTRKYTLWGTLAAYQATGYKTILEAAVRQADNYLATVEKTGIALADTGHPGLNGIPTMSILKPMLLLYSATQDEKYLSFARRIVADWDRPDGRAPNFIRNRKLDRPLHAWYPKPEDWCKSYELMSCVDGLVAFWSVTGDQAALEAAKHVRDLIAAHEVNSIGGVGIADRLLGADSFPYAATESCDTIHWIRLNIDLFMATGDDRYLDSAELAYYNAYLAGIFRDGSWSAFLVRDAGRHKPDKQCGYAYHHCCVDNMPRTFADVAETTVTKDRRDGRYRVNFYHDADVNFGDVSFSIRGGFPAAGKVEVKQRGQGEVAFRRPAWCPSVAVSAVTNGDEIVYALELDMKPRLVERQLVRSAQPAEEAAETQKWGEERYRFYADEDLRRSMPAVPSATIMYGPLVMARSARLGCSRRELRSKDTVNGKGWRVGAVRTLAAQDVFAPMEVDLVAPDGKRKTVRVCSYESAGDDCVINDGFIFSTRF